MQQDDQPAHCGLFVNRLRLLLTKTSVRHDRRFQEGRGTYAFGEGNRYEVRCKSAIVAVRRGHGGTSELGRMHRHYTRISSIPLESYTRAKQGEFGIHR